MLNTKEFGSTNNISQYVVIEFLLLLVLNFTTNQTNNLSMKFFQRRFISFVTIFIT